MPKSFQFWLWRLYPNRSSTALSGWWLLILLDPTWTASEERLKVGSVKLRHISRSFISGQMGPLLARNFKLKGDRSSTFKIFCRVTGSKCPLLSEILGEGCGNLRVENGAESPNLRGIPFSDKPLVFLLKPTDECQRLDELPGAFETRTFPHSNDHQ